MLPEGVGSSTPNEYYLGLFVVQDIQKVTNIEVFTIIAEHEDIGDFRWGWVFNRDDVIKAECSESTDTLETTRATSFYYGPVTLEHYGAIDFQLR